MRKYDLVCFDMDGTLTKLRSSWCWVHQHFEVDNEPAYQAFCSGEIDEPEFMRRDIALWKGKKPDVSIMDIALTFRDMPSTTTWRTSSALTGTDASPGRGR